MNFKTYHNTLTREYAVKQDDKNDNTTTPQLMIPLDLPASLTFCDCGYSTMKIKSQG